MVDAPGTITIYTENLMNNSFLTKLGSNISPYTRSKKSRKKKTS
jgi:hypothetical protein